MTRSGKILKNNGFDDFAEPIYTTKKNRGYDSRYNSDECATIHKCLDYEKDDEFVLPGLTAGTTGVLIAPGGVGKTHFAMQLSMMIASGHGEYERGGVIYFSAEDTMHSALKRMRRIFEHSGMFDENMADDQAHWSASPRF